MSYSKHIYTCLFAVVCCLFCPAQTNRINNLKRLIGSAHNPDEKLKAIFSLCEETESLNIDTLNKYAHEAALIASSQKNISDQHLAAYYVAYSFYQKGKLDSAINIVSGNLPVLEKESTHSFVYTRFALLNARGLMRKQQIKEALAQYYKVLNEAETNKDTLVQMMSMAGIGWVYDRTNDPRQALNWFTKGIELGKNTPYIRKTVYLYPNTGIMYNMLEKYDSAALLLQKGIQVSRETESLTDLANCLAIYAGNLMDMNKMSEAQKPLQEALEVRKKIGDPNDILTDMGTLAIYYSNTSQTQKGIALSLEGIKLAKQYHLPNKLSYLYDALAKNYKDAGDYQRYGETLARILDIKDSLYKQNSAEAIANLTEKYEVQKKENTIIRQQLDLVKKDFWIVLSLAMFFIVVVFGYLYFRNYRRKQKQKELDAIASAEENERKRIAADLHDNLGAYAASIASNVNLLAMGEKESISTEALKELQNNSNAIVADLSDTIWALKKEGLRITSISDRIKVFIQRIQPGYPGILIDVMEAITTDHLLSPAHGFHLFQILQEAINNALKHSGGNHIMIAINSSENGWLIKVMDNGKGLQTNGGSSAGNGLFNMQNRSRDAGWTIEWLSNNPNGTMVSIRNML